MPSRETEHAVGNENAEARRAKVIAMLEQSPGNFENRLLDALGDEDWRVRKEAVAVALRHAKRAAVLPILIRGICQSTNVGLRNAALEAAGAFGDEAVSFLVETLHSAPEDAKKFLVEALGDTKSERALAPLMEAADNADPNLAAAAMEALARLGGAQAEQCLRSRLLTDDPFQQMAALDGLARLGAVVEWEVLAPLLDDRFVRRVALKLLGRSRDIRAVEPLADALDDPSTYVAALAARGLARLYQESLSTAEAVESMAPKLSRSASLMLNRLLATGDLPTRQAAALLLVLAHDQSSLREIVRLAASGALASGCSAALRSWGKEVIPELLSLRAELRDQQKAALVEMISDLGNQCTSPDEQSDESLRQAVRATVLEALQDADEEVAESAARSLVWWVSPQDIHDLVRRGRHGGNAIARACGQTLEVAVRLRAGLVEEVLAQLDPEGSFDAVLTSAIASVGSTKVFEWLQAALSAKRPATRKEALWGLARVGDPRATDLIALALADEYLDVQVAAAEALGELKGDSACAAAPGPLVSALKSGSPALRAVVARSVGSLGVTEAIPVLRELVAQGTAGEVLAAMESLARMRAEGLWDLLREALDHPDEEVVKKALAIWVDTSPADALEHVAEALTHRAWDVRAFAANCMTQLGGPAAVEKLRECLAHEQDELVRSALRDALSNAVGRL